LIGGLGRACLALDLRLIGGLGPGSLTNANAQGFGCFDAANPIIALER